MRPLTLTLAVLLLLPLTATATPAVAKKAQAQTFKVTVKGEFRASAVACGRFVWTAAHLFDDHERECELTTVHGCMLPAKIVKMERGWDLAVLELPSGVTVEGPKWHPSKADIAEKVYAVGCPGKAYWTVSAGIISFHDRKDVNPFYWSIPLDQCDPVTWGGSSGCGIFMQDSGELVGLLVGGHSQVAGLGYLIPVRTMRDWAKAKGLEHCLPECCQPKKCKDCCCK